MKRAMIAMSGGVDSSVTAWLMQQRGFDCTGVTMRLFPRGAPGPADPAGAARTDIDDAADVASRLGMPLEVLEYTELFRRHVIDGFVRAYEQGLTPNPCIACNRSLKFGALLEHALAEGFDVLATGHYARVDRDPDTGRLLLRKALDDSKDQSYVLYMLTQEQLARLCLPLGELRKEETRTLAERLGLVNAHKHDSQDICFIPDGDYGAFLERISGRRYPEGDILDLWGRKVGEHRGLVRYTLGQRRGLRVAAGEPVYVCGKDPERNTLTVGPESSLYSTELLAGGMNWISVAEPKDALRVTARTRYRQTERPATAWPLPDGRMRLVFDAPQRAVTPGQAVVLYDGDLVVGGGTILSSANGGGA